MVAGRLTRRAAAALIAAAALAGLLALPLRRLPDPRPLRDPAWVRQRFGLTEWTALADVPAPALKAVLASEDDSFFRHHGLRWDELGSAAWDDLLSLRFKRGASSITQQVVRNAFLDRRKRLSRKWSELWLARRADALVGKRRLLEDYLNLAEWGTRGERGIAAAAREQLGLGVDKLDAVDGALLAWLLPQPRLRGPMLLRRPLDRRPARHVRFVLRQLKASGDLAPGDEAAALKKLRDLERAGKPSMPDGGRSVGAAD